MIDENFDVAASSFSSTLLALVNAVVAKKLGPLAAKVDKLEHAKSALQKTLAGLERKIAERE